MSQPEPYHILQYHLRKYCLNTCLLCSKYLVSTEHFKNTRHQTCSMKCLCEAS